MVYVLGNEACGKEEICSRLAAEVGGSYLSATVLLRSAVESDTDEGHKLSEMIKQGKIVPAAMTTQLLTTAMARLPAPYLVDGFPKSLDNMSPFEDQVGACQLALLFELSDELSKQRMTAQGKQEELIQRKLRNFATQTLPIAQALEGRQLLRKISAAEARRAVESSSRRSSSSSSSSGSSGSSSSSRQGLHGLHGRPARPARLVGRGWPRLGDSLESPEACSGAARGPRRATQLAEA